MGSGRAAVVSSLCARFRAWPIISLIELLSTLLNIHENLWPSDCVEITGNKKYALKFAFFVDSYFPCNLFVDLLKRIVVDRLKDRRKFN